MPSSLEKLVIPSKMRETFSKIKGGFGLETDTDSEARKLVTPSKKSASFVCATLEKTPISMRTKVLVSKRPKSFAMNLKKKSASSVVIPTPALDSSLILALKYPTKSRVILPSSGIVKGNSTNSPPGD